MSFNKVFWSVGIIASILFSSCITNQTQSSNIYYVAKNGLDENIGSSNKPFLTINKAAQVAMPGDVVMVREGIYREWINPPRGGTSEDKRIIYQAEAGADVRILGSELATGWKKQDNGLWKAEYEGGLFDKNNAFKKLSRHPEEVGIDESGDGWGWLKYGRWTHLGDIIVDGKGLTEKETLKEVEETEFTWYTEPHETKTILFGNFGKLNPNEAQTELSLRGYAFYPQKTGLNYITIKGFTFMNVASHWAPPTVHQPGAIGSNGGHHWIIEDNIIAYSKGLGISIGIPIGTSIDIPNGLTNSSMVGHHIIRNNVILRCGQGGIAGQFWNHNTEVYNNFIEDINYREEFGGWETAGIKFHNGDSLTIRNNFIRNIYTADLAVGAAHGIWNDFNNSNWNVTKNVILNTEGFGILTEANFTGPNMISNNVFACDTIAIYSTRGDAWANNLFIKSSIKWENQTWGDRVQIGNARWFQNLFMGGGLDAEIIEDKTLYNSNVFFDGASSHPGDTDLLVIDKSTNVSIKEENEQIVLSYNLDASLLDKEHPIVTNKKINLPFSFDASIKEDFFGNKREPKNIAGPFIKVNAGENKLVLYKFPPLYKKAKKIVK